MNQDIEKARVDHVTRMEAQMKHMQQQLAELQAENKWAPIVSTQVGADMTRVTLGFAGKRATIELPTESFRSNSTTDIVTALIENFSHNLIQGALVEVFQPEIERVQRNVANTAGAGKW